jgi:uncharacterized protein YlxP (DUF503 family)
MVVGICQIKLIIQDTFSLKEKRRVLKSILERVRNRFPVSIAEVGDHDLWQSSLIGFCMVSNEQQVVHATIDKVINFIENLCLAEVNVFHIEMITL